MNTEIPEYDFVIIGSGFGGSVSALRLSEKGYKVLVVEKGKWYHNADFPKNNWNFKKWLWLPSFRLFGIMKLTYFRHIAILSGVGVGGGSLVYANTLPKPKRGFYNHGSWASLADWENELAPFYEQANFMLGAVKNPYLGPADKALKAVAEKSGIGNEFEPTRVAVLFGDAPDQNIPDPFFGGKGPERTTCNYCGQCMTGCPNNSKNTLDKNYLHLAMGLGAEVRAEQEVTGVAPLDGDLGSTGYEITLRESTRFFKTTKKIKAGGVIFAGGVLGTVPLLLRLKRKTLPRLSPRLGFDIRSNNEALIGVTSTREEVDFSRGVAIGSILQVDENSHLEPCRYGNGSGAWRPTLMPAVNEPDFFKRIVKLVIKIVTQPIGWLRVYFVRDFGKQTVFMLFMQSMESTLQFKKSIWGISSKMATGNAPTAFIDEAHRLSELYADEIGGKPLTIFSETLTGIPSTAHILGGCAMGADPEHGVIDRDNRVFGYNNLFVCDGSMISANPGVNPSLSITAIAERAMSKIPAKNQ